jgi:hypothetical protein
MGSSVIAAATIGISRVTCLATLALVPSPVTEGREVYSLRPQPLVG